MIELMVKIVGELPKRLLRETDVERLNARAARKMQRAVVENFEGLGGEHFYKDAADSTRLEQHGAEAEVRVEHRGVRLRWKGSGDLPGGVVKPGAGVSSHTGRATKLLAIPAKKRMEAPGRYRPLFFMPVKGRQHLRGLLLEGEEKTAARKWKDKPAGRAVIVPKKNGAVMFRLVDETEHAPNPQVIPERSVLGELAQRDMLGGLRLLLRK